VGVLGEGGLGKYSRVLGVSQTGLLGVVRRRRERAEDGEVVLVLVERREMKQLFHRSGNRIPVPSRYANAS
jgi:hypothetical protein